LLATSRGYLNDRNVSDQDRAAFFASLEAVFSDDGADGLNLPEKLIPVWKDVLNSIARHLSATPALVPVASDDNLNQLIEEVHASPQTSSAEPVSTSPVQQGGDEGESQDVSVESLSEPPVPPSAKPPPPPRAKLDVIMTESEHELLSKALEQKRGSPSKTLSGEIPADPQLDASVLAKASSSDFKIDGSAPLSASEGWQ
jgi:hypothetical protein